MAKQQTENIFNLIKSLSKAEKRNFKLYATRLDSSENAKFIKLFDIIDKQAEYNEAQILKKAPEIKKQQLSNIKAHLYKQLLVSLRLGYRNTDTDIMLREQLDYAKVLYNKGLYQQSVKIIEKAKMAASHAGKLGLMADIIEFEKVITSQFITQGIAEHAEELSNESFDVNTINLRASTFSNVALQLYGVYIKGGYIRTPGGRERIKTQFEASMPEYVESELTSYERIFLYEAKITYYQILQNFPYAYMYAEKLINMFHENENLLYSFPETYFMAMNNYLTILFYAGYNTKMETALKKLRTLNKHEWSDNVRFLLFQAQAEHTINLCFLNGDYRRGVKLAPHYDKRLHEYLSFIDNHHLLIYYYKLGCLYFGNADYRKAIHYLNLVVNFRDTDLRRDIHTFSRLLLLISYFEMGDHDYVEYLLKSIYRFLLKKKELYKVLRLVLQFIRRTPAIPPDQLKEEFAKYLVELKALETDPYEKRAFLYLDLISWVESKVEDVPVSAIVKRKLGTRR